MIVGAVANLIGSLQTGLVALSLFSVVGVIVGLLYPDFRLP